MTPEILAERINDSLANYSDKDWNYSRIRLVTRSLSNCNSPYMLHFSMLDTTSLQGKQQLKQTAGEVKWGERHSSELGILELISLRINKALLDCTTDDHWNGQRPIIRLAKKEDLIEQGVETAFLYEVQEVAGEDFENR